MSLIQDLIPHMRRVQAAERDLRELGLLWQMIDSSAAIACPDEADSILGVITQTRQRFESLQTRLVEQLGKEVLAELKDELASAAQCAIDILVRNLFERTADVGFLATDDVLRRACLDDPTGQAQSAPALAQRLVAYRDKYSVYDDIVVLTPDGRVIARADAAGAIEASSDPHLAQATRATGYVEWFGRSDLACEPAVPTLFYAHRVEDANARCIGVLVLRFRHADEMQRIFESVSDKRRQAALVLLDADDRVIATNDEAHVPLGALVQCGRDGQVQLTHFAGREYLSVTHGSAGYQGYHGPAGWRAHAMVSLLTAFSGRHAQEKQPDGEVSLDNVELGRIQTEVDAINAELRRVVWNGRLVARSRQGLQSTLKAVLRQVHETGARTRARVAEAITDLCRTSLARQDHQAHELARLAADIMDRNLYERANDCRWWALSPAIAQALAADAPAGRSETLQRVLDHVNGLYTVYARLVVFDATGRIRGVSHDDKASSFLGQAVDGAWVDAVRTLTDGQRYAVTPFVACPLSDGLPTYVYLAAVREPATQALLGGVATVFHAQREFRAMVDDVLARRDGVAAFVDPQGRVLACTDERWPTGAEWPFGAQGRVTVLGVHYAVAAVAAGGYREFKRSDGYDNHVRAIVALRLGAAERRQTALTDSGPRALPRSRSTPSQEFALFTVGAGYYALEAPEVLEARPCARLVSLPGTSDASQALEGLLEVPDGAGGSCVVPVLCGRRLLGVDHAPRQTDGVVIVVADRTGSPRPGLGLRVDAVDSVLDIGPEHLQPPDGALRACAPHWRGLLKVAAGAGRSEHSLVLLLDAAALRRLALERATAS
jgi:chemotaxis signal transduction protein